MKYERACKTIQKKTKILILYNNWFESLIYTTHNLGVQSTKNDYFLIVLLLVQQYIIVIKDT